ncbi:hypothetical protein DFR72_111195 [Lentzea flaviverrucosa]|uniref:Uncharacterized protein n=2 Tax=Lentzea flaviverrucosa TaxID=200379 RepID=A0A1H9WU26_9PSEU|nr:hypothetical protein DFR72_111195 [Lentzea flaviverrucosa]SES36873.1 hypothetical protein SAMN05216195_112190 [Lentzea flaviverrucosa]
MRAHLGKEGVELSARFRVSGRGPTVIAARFNIPLRFEDLVSILYAAPLTGEQLADADRIRETVLDVLLNHGANKVADDKARLERAIETRAADVDQPRLITCKRRVTELFLTADNGLRNSRDRSSILRRTG